jgi:dTDP-4-amino-4,6-dideoxygalactose transaminase
MTRNALRCDLAELFGYAHAVLFGRARSGITALFEVMGTHRDFTFIIPSNICPPILIAGIGAGTQISLADVDPETGLASDETLSSAVAAVTGQGVVMPTHLYGFVQKYPKTLEIARRRGWFVLENDCVATSARISPNAPKRAFGDGLIVSFGPGKTLDAMGGGGVFLTDDPQLAARLQEREALYPAFDQVARERETVIVGKRRRLLNQRPSKSNGSPLVERLLFEELGDLRYGFSDDLIAPLQDALGGLRAKVENCLERLEWWSEALKPSVEYAQAPSLEHVIPWRAVRRIPKFRTEVVNQLRDAGFDAGTNYQPLTANFPVLLADRLQSGAESWGREVLNLWVSEDYDRERINRAAGVISKVFDHAGL